MSLTQLERIAIQGILDSDFMDGAKTWPDVGKDVWSWSANKFSNKKTFSGVISSLNKKGYVVSQDYDRDEIVRLTEAGWKAFQGE